MRASAWVLLLASCADPAAVPGVQVNMDFSSDAPYAAPFPSEHMRTEVGIDVSSFPNPRQVDFIRDLRRILSTTDGFGTTSGIFFSLTGAPDLEGGDVYVAPVDDLTKRAPVAVEYRENGGPHGAEHLLSILPQQGQPLDANRTYVAVVERGVVDGLSLGMAFLAADERPDGMDEAAYEAYRSALERLDPERIAGISVFTTGDPTEQMKRARTRILADGAAVGAFELSEVYDDYCVFHSTIDMPIYQQGEPPFDTRGGGWTPDLDLQGRETANYWVTVPKGSNGPHPVVLFVRTGGGGERPVIDRGVRQAPGGATVPGSGPAVHISRAGWASMSIDGPHGGLRNVTGGDEQLLIFNIQNPTAMRDNVRQSAAELVLAADLVDEVTLTSTACSGTLDSSRMVLMGHSMGATIGPLAMAVEPRFSALILSGAGGSWIENIIHKRSPLIVKPLAEIILSYEDFELHPHDPSLSLLQWAGESADPPVYGELVRDRHVLMFQGIVDTYILPPIANANTLSLQLDVAEPVLEDSILPLLPLTGRSATALPAQGNAAGLTRVVVQHGEGPIEDGHEVMFQLEAPKRQYRCFLSSLLQGTPIVVPSGAADDPC